MEPIDWSKPIELMNGEPREHWVHSEAVWVGVKGNHVGFYTDRQGCIGGVQVVRNRDVQAIEQERDALKAKLEYADTRIRRLETCVEDFLELTEVPDANCSCHLGPPCRDCVEYGRIREVCEWATALLKERGV